jgi:hypothetical protein
MRCKNFKNRSFCYVFYDSELSGMDKERLPIDR